MKPAELRELSYEDLAEKLTETKEEAFNLRFQYATNQLDNTARLPQVRREVARIATIMREMEIKAYYEQESAND